MVLGKVSALGDVFAATEHCPEPIVPLTDEQVQDFIQNGYITVEAATLPAQFHVSVADKARVLREADTPGWSSNNCFPILPELGEVLKEPHVHGALTGLLGAGYAMHPHRHCHQSAPGNSDQGIHQDSYEDDVQVRHHKPRWCMAMYYPQDVTPDLGPTAVVPGSHWYNDPHRVGDQRSSDELFGKGSGTPGHWCHETEEYHAVVPAGSVVIVHYELWHRATKLLAEDGRMRFMFKFLFVRMTDPTSPSWNCAAEALPGQQDGWARMHADAKSLAIWEWMRGRPPPPRTERSMLRPWDETKEHRDTLDGLLDMLRANSFLGIESEPQRLNAAYELGRFGGAAVGPLVEILRRESAAKSCWFQQHGLHNPGQLYSRTALAAVGKPAVPALIELLNVTREGEHEDWQVCAAAADALGDIGPMVGPDAATIQNGAAVQALVAVIEVEPHPLVVRNAVEALGYFGSNAVPALGVLSGLLAPLPDDDSDTTRNRPSWVRHNAALAIAKIVCAAEPCDLPASLEQLLLERVQAQPTDDPYVDDEAATKLAQAHDESSDPEHWVVVGNSKLALQAIALKKQHVATATGTKPTSKL